MRSLGGGAKAILSIGLVFRIVAVKPNNLAVAFEGKDMSRDPVQEPAIMRDNNGAASETFQRLFERAQSVDIQIVRWFIEQQNVGAFLQHLRQMNTIALAPGERANLFLLVRAGKIESGNIRSRVHFASAYFQQVSAAT